MGRLNFNPRQVDSAIRKKLQLETRSGREETGWYMLDGKKLFSVTLPKIHGVLKPGTAKSIMSDVKLGADQFDQLVRCPMTGSDYKVTIRAKVEEGIL